MEYLATSFLSTIRMYYSPKVSILYQGTILNHEVPLILARGPILSVWPCLAILYAVSPFLSPIQPRNTAPNNPCSFAMHAGSKPGFAIRPWIVVCIGTGGKDGRSPCPR